MIQIYHNSRCSKSREGLQIVEESGKEYSMMEYMKNPLTKKELTELLDKLKLEPMELIRKNETIWKENFKNKTLSNSAIIDAMVEFPSLIERPIVVNGNKAIIGRPPSLIKDIL